MEWKEWVDKRVFIKLKNGDCYNGNVISIDDNFILIIDRFSEKVGIALSEISKIKDESHNGGGRY
jgi:small nuclear ribonucleoprotein (snRNP)-like protein